MNSTVRNIITTVASRVGTVGYCTVTRQYFFWNATD